MTDGSGTDGATENIGGAPPSHWLKQIALVDGLEYRVAVRAKVEELAGARLLPDQVAMLVETLLAQLVEDETSDQTPSEVVSSAVATIANVVPGAFTRLEALKVVDVVVQCAANILAKNSNS